MNDISCSFRIHCNNISDRNENVKNKEKYLILIRVILGILIMLSLYYLIQRKVELTTSKNIVKDEEKKEGQQSDKESGKKKVRVVIDVGHGGKDPGKVGINGALEKDINLQIAAKLKQFLEESDVEVIMTREEDVGLYDENASNKKVQDMKRRVELIEEAAPLLIISIHQNSYHEEYVHGAQVFYYTGSEEGKELAEIIQQSLLNEADPENKRLAKANDSYYLLKKTSAPIVIVECGFLSNSEEAQKLTSDYYQEKLAWAIHLGVWQYINSQSK